MTTVTTPLLAGIQPTVAPAEPATPWKGAPEKFQNALAQALDVQSQIQAPASVSTSGATADAQARAREALGLQGPGESSANGGDAVLNGLQKLRGVFNNEIATMADSTKDVASSEGLYRAQVAAARFSLFMEVGSKLAGKAGQAFESLLKGQ